MSRRAEVWWQVAIAAGCVIVIASGAFAISGHNSTHERQPATVPVQIPSTSNTAPSTHPSRHSTPSPTTVVTVTPTPVPTHVPTHSSAPVAAPSVVPSTTSSSASSPATAAIPPSALGTFSYATTGSEETNIPDTKRTFPKTTTITNTKEGCGVESTWKPVPEHVQSQLLCPSGDALKVKSYKTTISFFGVSSGEDFECSGDSFLYQPGAKAGQVWKYKCKSADAVASQVATVIGYDKMTVGGTTVRALDVRVQTTITGSDSGKSTQEYWIATNKPVLLEETGTVTATQQSIHYQETYSLTLSSLTAKE